MRLNVLFLKITKRSLFQKHHIPTNTSEKTNLKINILLVTHVKFSTEKDFSKESILVLTLNFTEMSALVL